MRLESLFERFSTTRRGSEDGHDAKGEDDHRDEEEVKETDLMTEVEDHVQLLEDCAWQHVPSKHVGDAIRELTEEVRVCFNRGEVSVRCPARQVGAKEENIRAERGVSM